MTSPYDDRAGTVRELAAALSAAIAEHLRAVESRRGESDPAVYAAYDRLRDAFLAYEDALYETYDEVTPFEVVSDEEEDEDEEEEEEDGDEDLEDEDLEDEDLEDDEEEEGEEDELEEEDLEDDDLATVSDDYDEIETVDDTGDSGDGFRREH
jgi:hypothetical protein